MRHLSEALSLPAALSISSVILDHKSQYYKQFKIVEDPKNHAEATHFILVFLDCIIEGQECTIANIAPKRTVLENALTQIEAKVALDELAKDILFILVQAHILTPQLGIMLDTLHTSTGKSKATIRTRITDLENMKLVELASKKPLSVKLSAYAQEILLETGR
ncbi:Fic family protein [Arcanobacterium pluranimalium]|uniref:hypothetical protein n=1 Tax=Arcanobacterium pluranimalium TaxID=108028 RepID=UPI001958C0A3|nr:hypothetical protein [Arcanobacterium pluranimalium]MBM7825851.1 Fic family protein [Arcanobacterium pluranimalium]